MSCQEKYGFVGSSLAPVGGYIEADELPLLAAKREVLEELGLASPDWVPLRSLAHDHCAHYAHSYYHSLTLSLRTMSLTITVLCFTVTVLIVLRDIFTCSCATSAFGL